MSEIDKNFDIFDILRSILSHFLTEVCEYFFESLMDYEICHFFAFAKILTPKVIQKVTNCTKPKILNFFDSFGVTLKCFQSKTLQRSLQKMYCLAHLFLELRTKPFRKLYRNCIKKDKKFKFFDN